MATGINSRFTLEIWLILKFHDFDCTGMYRFLYVLMYLFSYLFIILRRFGVCELRVQIVLMTWEGYGRYKAVAMAILMYGCMYQPGLIMIWDTSDFGQSLLFRDSYGALGWRYGNTSVWHLQYLIEEWLAIVRKHKYQYFAPNTTTNLAVQFIASVSSL